MTTTDIAANFYPSLKQKFAYLKNMKFKIVFIMITKYYIIIIAFKGEFGLKLENFQHSPLTGIWYLQCHQNNILQFINKIKVQYTDNSISKFSKYDMLIFCTTCNLNRGALIEIFAFKIFYSTLKLGGKKRKSLYLILKVSL